jgi:hypothetical protein
MMVGSPGAHVICCTGLLRASHTLGAMVLGSPFLLSTGLPSFPTIGMRGSVALTLAGTQSSRVGSYMNWPLGL